MQARTMKTKLTRLFGIQRPDIHQRLAGFAAA